MSFLGGESFAKVQETNLKSLSKDRAGDEGLFCYRMGHISLGCLNPRPLGSDPNQTSEIHYMISIIYTA